MGKLEKTLPLPSDRRTLDFECSLEAFYWDLDLIARAYSQQTPENVTSLCFHVDASISLPCCSSCTLSKLSLPCWTSKVKIWKNFHLFSAGNSQRNVKRRNHAATSRNNARNNKSKMIWEVTLSGSGNSLLEQHWKLNF